MRRLTARTAIRWADRRDRGRQVGGAERVRAARRGDALHGRACPRAARRPADAHAAGRALGRARSSTDGAVDRERVGEIVFESPEELALARVGPSSAGRPAGRRVARRSFRPRRPLAVVEVPLLFEAGLEDAFDATVSVIAADGTRARRARRAWDRAARGPERPPALPGGEGRPSHSRDPQRRHARGARAAGRVHRRRPDGDPGGRMSPVRTMARGGRSRDRRRRGRAGAGGCGSAPRRCSGSASRSASAGSTSRGRSGRSRCRSGTTTSFASRRRTSIWTRR